MFVTILINKRRLKFLAGLTVVLALLIIIASLQLPDRLAAVFSQFAQGERLVPIYYVDTDEKKVAFSFDASWGADRTSKILEILRENEIKTTFFLTGFWVEDYPELVKLIVEEGHELGNHTATHPHLNALTAEQITAELKTVEKMLQEIWGQKPTLFRPPFGEYNNDVISTASKLGYKTIQWSIDSLDWQDLAREEIVQRVNSRAHKGAIVLFHNNGLYTAEALPEIIAHYKKHGYQIVPVSELIYHENYTIDPHSGAQIPNQKKRN